MGKSTHRHGVYRVVVSDGFRARVYRGLRKVADYRVVPPNYLIELGVADDAYIAESAAREAKENKL